MKFKDIQNLEVFRILYFSDAAEALASAYAAIDQLGIKEPWDPHHKHVWRALVNGASNVYGFFTDNNIETNPELLIEQIEEEIKRDELDAIDASISVAFSKAEWTESVKAGNEDSNFTLDDFLKIGVDWNPYIGLQHDGDWFFGHLHHIYIQPSTGECSVGLNDYEDISKLSLLRDHKVYVWGWRTPEEMKLFNIEHA